MITRNRGTSKSVVETLGLIRKNRRRASNCASSTEVNSSQSSESREEAAARLKVSLNRRIGEVDRLTVLANCGDGCQSCQEADGFESAETTPANWSFSPVRLIGLPIDEATMTTYENGVDLAEKGIRCERLSSEGGFLYPVHDEVLQEILKEVSIGGVVFPSRRQFLQNTKCKTEMGEKEDVGVVRVFGEKRLQSLFDRMSVNLKVINREADKKDVFLAGCGLVRPGIGRALRRRRVEKWRQRSRGTAGRLRPNPRPRRFSDMVNVTMEGVEQFSRLSRSGRRVRDRNARAAAKKLAQAKSQASHILQSKTGAKRGRPRKSSRPLSETSKWIVSRSTMQTRPRRSVNIRHHIEWKFCYGGTSGEVANSRKRRAPLSGHVPIEERENEGDEAEEEEGNGEEEEEEEDEEEVEEEEEEEEKNSEDKRGVSTKRRERVSKQLRSDECEVKHAGVDDEYEGMGARSKTALAEEMVDVGEQERNAPRCSELKRRARSMLFERKRRRSALELDSAVAGLGSGERSSSESSNTPDGVGGFYRRGGAVVKGLDGAGFVSDQRRKGGSFYARSGRACTTSRTAAATATASSMVSGAEESAERTRSGHHRRDLHRRLTLLDRVVLGLTCSVVQDGDEIHVKQLHSDDLSILLQRVTETGFNINGLSTRTNANNEQEFNITLTYHARAETSIRQARKHNMSGTSGAFRGSSVLPRLPFGALSAEVGDTGDGVCSETHSDAESGLRKRGLVLCDSPPPLRPNSTMGFNRNRVVSVTSRRRVAHPSGGRMLHPLQRMAMRHMSASAAAAAAAAVARSSGSVVRRAHPRESKVVEEVSECEEVLPSPPPLQAPPPPPPPPPPSAHSHIYTQPIGHQSHLATSPFVLPLAGGLSFRRHSPRKVIRKVYTGTSTVPKILNRRRPVVGGNAHQPSQQASQPSATQFALSQTTGTAVLVGSAAAAMTMPTTRSSSEEAVIVESRPSQLVTRGHASAATEPVTVEAIAEPLEEKDEVTGGMDEGAVGVGSPTVIATSTGVATTPATVGGVMPSVPVVPRSTSPSEEEQHNNPANSMCASQLLRLKRHQDERPQVASGSRSISAEAVMPVSVASSLPGAASSSQAPSSSLSSSSSTSTSTSSSSMSHSLQKGQRKLNPAQHRAEVGGFASSAEVDDGADFELDTTLIHMSPPLLLTPKVSLPQSTVSSALPTTAFQTDSSGVETSESLRATGGIPLISHTHSSNCATASASASALPMVASTMAHLHQPSGGASHSPVAVLQCTASSGLSSYISKALVPGKRPLIPAVEMPAKPMHAATSQGALGVCGKGSLLTGRPVVGSGKCAVSTTTDGNTVAATGNKRAVVHKYHTFRKISPKNQTMPFSATAVIAATITATTTTAAATVAATTHTHTAVTTTNTTAGAAATAATTITVNTVANERPATSSQLLKSLLECGGGSALPNAHPSRSQTPCVRPPGASLRPITSPLSLGGHAGVLPGASPLMPAARFSQPPVHQSRGTWQLGGRAIVIGASITTPSNSTSRLQGPPSSSSVSSPPPDPPVLAKSNSSTKTVEMVTSEVVPHPVLHETVGS